MNVYSRIDPTQILHIINRRRDIQPGRVDLVEAGEMLQVAAMRMVKHTTFKAHKHIPKLLPVKRVTQETWIIISGTVQVYLYDLDDSLLHTDVLETGDSSITLEGGHNYKILSDDAVVYECKSGPYSGQETDKMFIE